MDIPHFGTEHLQHILSFLHDVSNCGWLLLKAFSTTLQLLYKIHLWKKCIWKGKRMRWGRVRWLDSLEAQDNKRTSSNSWRQLTWLTMRSAVLTAFYCIRGLATTAKDCILLIFCSETRKKLVTIIIDTDCSLCIQKHSKWNANMPSAVS